jgi:hypothetical protein
LVGALDLTLVVFLAGMLFFLPLSEGLKNVCFAVALVLWLVRRSVRREPMVVRPLGWGLVAFLAVAGISAAMALDRYQAARGAWDVFRYVSTFFLMLNGLGRRQHALWCLGAILVSAVLGTAFGLGQYWNKERNISSAINMISKTEAELRRLDGEIPLGDIVKRRKELGDAYRTIIEILDRRRSREAEQVRRELRDSYEIIEGTVPTDTPSKLDEARRARYVSLDQRKRKDKGLIGSASGKIGNAAVFASADGTSLFNENRADLSTGDVDFTIAAWVYLDTTKDIQLFVSKSSPAEYSLEYVGGHIQGVKFHVHDGLSFHSLHARSFGTPSPKTWFLVVAWHDATRNTLNIQINNGPFDKTPYSSGLNHGAGTFSIGGGFSAWHPDGRIDGVGFWKRLLSPAERTHLYNVGKGLDYPFDSQPALRQGLKAYWKLDEEAGRRADSAGSNHLTPTMTQGASIPVDFTKGQGEIERQLTQVVNRAINRGDVAVKIHSVGHPNHSATYLLMMVGLVLAGSLERSFRPAVRASFVGVLALLVVALVFSYSRAGMVTMVLMTVAVLVLARRWRLMAALAVLSVALLLLPHIRERLPRAVEAIQQPMKIGAIYDRVHVWRTVVRGVVRDRPLFGAGPRNFNFIDKRRYGLGRSWDYFNHAHSLYMNVAAEMGLLGLGVLVGWLGIFLGSWWSERRMLEDGVARLLWFGAGSAFLALTVSGIVTTTLHTEGAMLLMAVWGLFFSVQRTEGR